MWPAFANDTSPVSRLSTPTHAVRNMFAGLLLQSSAFTTSSAAAGERKARIASLMRVFAVIMYSAAVMPFPETSATRNA